MPEKINVGLIGCGRIMPAHLNGYMQLMKRGVNVRIKALCDMNREDALRFVKRGEGPGPRVAVGPPGDPLLAPHLWVHDFQESVDVEIYADYKEMLRHGDVDAVEIYAPPFCHHTMAVDSLMAGKHALVEKPFAVTVKAGRKMVKAAKEARRVLGVAENLRYVPETRMERWAIMTGCIGEIQMIVNSVIGCYWSPDKIVANTSWRHKKIACGAGPVLDFGAHIFDKARYYCGEIDEVQGATKIFEKVRAVRDESGSTIERVDNEVEDSFVAVTRFRNGAIGQFCFSWSLHGEPTIVGPLVYGSKGCMKNGMIILDDGTRTPVKDLFERNASLDLRERFLPIGMTDSYGLETLEFLRAIWEDREMETSGEEGLRDLAVCYSIIEASRSHRPVRVTDVETGATGAYEEEINAYYGL
jgi:predicted dehydrogenase